MGEVTNSDLLNVLLDIKQQTGAVNATLTATADALKQHINDDKDVARALFGRIETLQLGAARQKGFLTALAGVGSILGAGIGYIIDRMTLGHH